MPTGAGKTVVMSSIANDFQAPQIAIAHRQELVGQISLAFARAGIYHRITAPNATVNAIISQHVEELGQPFVQQRAPVAVAGIDTLIRRTDELAAFLQRVQWWQIDEAHHLLEANKWGRGVGLMPQAAGLGWTATPLRSDKRSLRRGEGGVFDAMAIGPSMRELVDAGYLAEYRIYAPPAAINASALKVTGSGDFSATELHDATARSAIVGDVVGSYLRFAAGKNGVTFAVDRELGEQHLAAFLAAGVPAALLTDKTPAAQRIEIMRAFRRQDIKQLVNQDIVGEGLDVPCIEVCSMARATASYGLFVQQFGRALRPLPGKQFGILIDHVGNVARHGLPDAPQAWSLDSPRREPPSDQLPVRQCPAPSCFRVFEGYSMTCPHCGFRPERQTAQAPELVEGDLTEYGPELLARLRAQAVPKPPPKHLPAPIRSKVAQQQAMRAQVQAQLAEGMAIWASVQTAGGMELSAAYRKFYRLFGVDVLTAQTLGVNEAVKLLELIREKTWHEYSAA